jgi:hypothetical protein
VAVVVHLVTAERQIGRDGDGHHHRRVLVLGVDPALQLRELLLDVAVPGDRFVGVLDRREKVGDAELAAGVGDLDAPVHDFEEGRGRAMSFRFAHG